MAIVLIIILAVVGGLYLVWLELRRRGLTITTTIYCPKENLRVGDVVKEKRLNLRYIPFQFLKPGKIKKLVRGDGFYIYFLTDGRFLYASPIKNPTEKEEGYMLVVEYKEGRKGYKELKQKFDSLC